MRPRLVPIPCCLSRPTEWQAWQLRVNIFLPFSAFPGGPESIINQSNNDCYSITELRPRMRLLSLSSLLFWSSIILGLAWRSIKSCGKRVLYIMFDGCKCMKHNRQMTVLITSIIPNRRLAVGGWVCSRQKYDFTIDVVFSCTPSVKGVYVKIR